MFENNSVLRVKLLKFAFIYFLIFTSIPSPSTAAGRGAVLVGRHGSYKPAQGHADAAEHAINERLLRVHTGDYGRYDPAPTFVKPPFKVILN